jgi:ligand-binding sensor domain-containing protein
MVGYEGAFAGLEDNDPKWMLESGGVDRVRLHGTVLETEHRLLATPPGVEPGYPEGRYKLRSVYVIRAVHTGPYAGDIWFGASHGVAMWSQRFGQILEHHHCAINGYKAAGDYIIMTGDFFGLALDARGDVWIGGAHREARVPYARSGGDFWAAFDFELDAWPDRDDRDRTDDGVSALTVDVAGDLWIGSMANNLARYRPSTAAFEYFDRSKGTPDGSVLALAADPDGSIWVGTWIGLGRYQPATGGWTYYYSFTLGLPSDYIRSLQVDTRTSPRTLYIGTGGGVSIYRGP